MLASLVVLHFVVQVFHKLPHDCRPPFLPLTLLVTCTAFGIEGGVDLTLLKGGDTGPALFQSLGEVAYQVVDDRPNRANNAATLNRQGKATFPGLRRSVGFGPPQ